MNALEIRERIRAIWNALSQDERWSLFADLDDEAAEEVFSDLAAADQADLLELLDLDKRRRLVLILPPDDIVDLMQALPPDARAATMALLEGPARVEVQDLSRFAPDEAGGLMTPRFLTLRPHLDVGRALSEVRGQARGAVETISTLYICADDDRLLGVLSLRELLAGEDQAQVRDLMSRDVLFATPTTDREQLGRMFSDNGLTSVPIVDETGVMQGIVTIDDVVEAVEEEVTEDMQRMGGLEALEAPYLRSPLSVMIKKRAGWLSALFLGEMLTATAMGHYEDEISRAVILAVFVPLIISSGGNSGSQASTLLIRAMALDEVRPQDWGLVAWRETISGLCLGGILGIIGMIRIAVWQAMFGTYGPHWPLIAATVGVSLVGVVLFGTLAGSMLPFLLRRVGFDPASASAPFVATLVDVSGLVIYFSAASILLRGILL
jgi:magnesium transporter